MPLQSTQVPLVTPVLLFISPFLVSFPRRGLSWCADNESMALLKLAKFRRVFSILSHLQKKKRNYFLATCWDFRSWNCSELSWCYSLLGTLLSSPGLSRQQQFRAQSNNKSSESRVTESENNPGSKSTLLLISKQQEFRAKGLFTNYVYHKRGVDGPKMSTICQRS